MLYLPTFVTAGNQFLCHPHLPDAFPVLSVTSQVQGNDAVKSVPFDAWV